MESNEIFSAFAGTKCGGCGGLKPRHQGFCKWCFRELPAALKTPLMRRFDEKFQQAYVACLSWFRTHPFQGEHRARQQGLFEEKA